MGAVIPWATQKRQARISLRLGLSVAVLLLATVPFWVTPLDLVIQGAAWQGEAGWSLGEKQPWKWIYHFGTLPAVVMAVAALTALLLGLRGGNLASWTKAAAYLVLCMAIGPGILVNLVLKDHWGRPRPRDVDTFGGDYPAERVWIADPASPGKSFPCGHCTMGFYFFAPGIMLWHLGRRRAAVGMFALAVGLGLLLGIARILQGGHFASDVLWGAGICWLVALGLFYAMGLDERLEWNLSLPSWFRRGPMQLAVMGLVLLLVGAILISTPYRREDSHDIKVMPSASLELSLVLEGTRHRISLAQEAEPGRIRSEGSGHGVPGSGVKATWTERMEPEGQAYFQFKQRLSGWFSELDHRNEIVVPAVPGEVRVRIQSGVAEIDFGHAAMKQDWKIEVKPGASCRWTAGEMRGAVAAGNTEELELPLTPGPASR